MDAIETKLDDPDTVPLSQLTQLLQAAIDKTQVLSGNPDRISGSLTVTGSVEDFKELKESTLIKYLKEVQARDAEGCPPENQVPFTQELADILEEEEEKLLTLGEGEDRVV